MTAVVIGVAVVAMLLSAYISWSSVAGSTALSPLFLFVVGSLLFVNIGFVAWFLDSRDEPWAPRALLSASIGLLSASVGGSWGCGVAGMSRRWRGRPALPIRVDLSYELAMLAAMVVIGVVLLYFVLLGFVPLISSLRQLFTEGFSPYLMNTYRIARDPYVNPDARFIPLQGFMEAVRYFGLPIVAVWFVDFYRRGVHRYLSMAMVVAAGALITFSGQRWPLMYLLLSIVVYLSWTLPHAGRYKKLLRRIFVTAVVVAIAMSVLLGRTLEEHLSYSEMLLFGAQDFYTRLFFGNVEVPFVSYSFFPDQEEWLLGESYLQNLRCLFPGHGESYPVTFNKLIVGDNSGFTAPPDLYTEAYINFNWAGVVVIPFAWGVVLAAAQHVILHARRLTTLSYCALSVTTMSLSACSGTMFVVGGLIVIVFIMMTVQGLALLGVGSRPQPLGSRVAVRSHRTQDMTT